MLDAPARCDWCQASRRSQNVVVIDVAKLPASVRRNTARPDADGTLGPGIPSNVMARIAMKKVPMAIPITICGITKSMNAELVVSLERIQYDTANAMNA